MRQVRDRTYESVLHESRMVWREMLSRVDVEDAGPTSEQASRRLTIFYTGLYRSLLFPRRLDEVDPNGKVLHYSPYDQQGRTREGYCVTDNGFWDTFRTCYTVLALAYPDHLDKIVQGWLNAYREGGWLPQWSSPGYRSAMVGTFSDNVIADAVLKDVLSADWLDHAFAALSQDAFVQGDSGRGKKDYAFYDANGYIGDDAGVSDEVSLTLDYGFADYAAACAFAKMGKSTEAGKLRARSHKAVGALFDEQTGLMRPKSRAGSFTSNFSPNRWGYGYVEGSPWHHSFPPYDLRELSRLHGSAEKLAHKIHEMLVTPSFFQAGSYGGEIHEMTEMRAFAMGQYGHNNQPSHHILHLLLSLDGSRQECAAPECDDAHPECLTSSKTLLTAADNSAPFCARLVGESAVHDVLERGYGVEHYAGDEDNGEMGAWYVLSALGLFEPAPGTDYGYALGSPLFRRVAIWRGVARGSSDTPTLLIESRKAGTLAVRHVQRVLLDGAEIGTLSHQVTLRRRSILPVGIESNRIESAFHTCQCCGTKRRCVVLLCLAAIYAVTSLSSGSAERP
jgi:putative alpha-1,2-mannosidase